MSNFKVNDKVVCVRSGEARRESDGIRCYVTEGIEYTISGFDVYFGFDVLELHEVAGLWKPDRFRKVEPRKYENKSFEILTQFKEVPERSDAPLKKEIQKQLK